VFYHSYISIVLSLLTALPFIGSVAQSNDQPEKDQQFSKTIPLKRSGNLFFIEINVADRTGNFILDTGAEGLVVNETYFRDYKLDRSREVGTINGNAEYAKYYKVSGLSLGELKFKDRDADVLDLSQIENSRGLKVLGLIGLDFFKDYLLEIDLRSASLILHDKDFEMIGSKPYIDVPTRSLNGVPSILVNVNGEKLRFILDTGAEMNVIHNKLDKAVYEGMEIIRTTELLGADGSKTQVLVAKLRSVEIDQHELKDALTLVLSMNSTRSVVNVDIAGTLGYPFFSEGKVLFDMRRKRLKMYASEAE
jgi:predicted aspartyl protease